MKKVFFLFLILVLCTWSASAVTLDATIDSPEELKLLMDSEDTTVMAGSYTLAGNMDMSSIAGQSPIGSVAAPFTGSFDGNGYAIKGILLETADIPAFGLFGYVDSATICNLTTYGKVISTDTTAATEDTAGTGGIVGCAWGSTTLKNLTNYCTVDGVNKVGGIVGGVHCNTTAGDQTKELRNLKNYGDVSGEKMLGGIAARMVFSSQDITHTIENLYNAGAVSTSLTSGSYYAGIVALVYSNQTPVLFLNCQNDGDLTAPGRAGGIAGFFRNYSNDPEKLVFKNCINNGKLTVSDGYVGGIFSYCGNQGTVANIGTFENCYSAGKIVTAATNYVEPIGGVPRTSEIVDCYYAADIGGSATHGVLITEAADVAEKLTAAEGWIVYNGVPELAVYHTHILGAYTPVADGHAQFCYCGYTTEVQAHIYENSLCTVCGFSSCVHSGGRTFDSVKVAATCAAGGIDLYLCADCGNLFEAASAKDADAHSGNILLVQEQGKAVYACAECKATYVTRTETDVYVSAAGETVTVDNAGVIGMADTPFASFADAMAHAAAICAADVTVTVHIADTATVPSGYVSHDFDGHIVVTGGTLTTANQFSLGGALTVENITLTPSAYTVWEARGHKITLGEGIVMGNEKPMYVVGGWDSHFSATGDVPSHGYSTDVTIRSGRYNYVSGGNRDMKAEYRGAITITVGATDPADTLIITKILCGASLGDDYATEAKLTFTVGDIDFANTGVLYMLSGSQRGERSNFDADIYLCGKPENFTGVRFHGRTYTADLYVDTSISGIEETVAALMQGEMQLHAIGAYTVPAMQTADTAADTVGIHAYTYGNVRVTVLSDTAVRIEDTNGGFVDAATLMVPHREEFAGAAVRVDEKDGVAILETDKLVVNLPMAGATVADVRVFAKDGEVLFDYYSAKLHGTYSSLPAPADTPDAWVLADNGILPAEDGMAYAGSSDTMSDWRTVDSIDLYVLCPFGDAAALRRDFVTLTGRTNLSDIKFYGSWYSRWSKFNDTQKLAMIEEYRDHDVPLDVIVIDTEWRANTDGTGYETNTELYPDMQGFLAKAEAAGVYVLFNDHTHKTSLTILTPEEFKWQCANICALMEMGLDGWWYDRNWSYTIQSPYTNILYSTVGQILYYDTMAKYHADTAADGSAKRVLMLTNADWLRHGFLEGNPSVMGHRYGMQWSGDIYGDSLQLGREIENAVLAGVVGGSPHISADLGGFRNNDVVSENAFIRWMQFAAFSGAVRVHSDINPKNPHYPWSYTEVGETAIRNILHMRYHLMPYHYALAREVYDSGMPILRRLDFYYPEYAESQDNSQYLLGRDILVAPYTGTPGDGAFAVPAAWLHTADGKAGLDAAYYNTGNVAKEQFYIGEPDYTERVTEISQFWDQWGPNGVDVDYFAARYTGQITPSVDCYLGIVVDDGGRVYIDGELYAGTFTNTFADSQVNTETPLKAGETYDIVIEYYERTSKSQLHLVYDPVTAADKSARTVFIPDGEWIDVFTGECITGPKTITVVKDVYTAPIYVRKGAVLPAAKVESPLTKADWQNLSLNLYGLGEGTATVYEDDGSSEDYKNGESRFTKVDVTTEGDVTTLTISAADGGFTTDYTARTVSVRVHSDTPITSALVNGREAAVTKIEKDASAIPFADSGASPASDIYEITFTASLAAEHTVKLSTAATPLVPTVGDVNADGVLDVQDALVALHALLNNTELPAADMNGDGKLSLLDILLLLKEIVR